jgi:prepilin-type N-terminal cleavage/methylation domain-containing protein
MAGMTSRMRSRRGFTMVELLVVIIIISVLVAIALPRYFAAIYAGRVRACQSNFKIINTAVQAYFAQNHVWPTDVTDMLPPDDPAATAVAPLVGGQLTETPICPFATVDAPIPYDLVEVLQDGTTQPAGGGDTPGNPVVGVVSDWTNHWPTAQWQNATEHGAAAAP